MFAGCAYRRRTGACTCPNPPIGCVREPQGISFPAHLSSYRELRAASASAPPPQPLPLPPRAEPVARPPQPLSLRIGTLPSLAWAPSAGDAGRAASSGLLLFVDDEEAALTLPAALLVYTLPSAAALQRLPRKPAAALLRCSDAGWEAEWPAFVAAAGTSTSATATSACLAGLRVDSVAEALSALQLLQTLNVPLPLLLALPLNPASPRQHRQLAGLCRRRGVQLAALDALGDAQLRGHPACEAAGAGRVGGSVEALLAW
jgi:hypothetical protein